MILCPKCGKEMKENAIRCIHCGSQLPDIRDNYRNQGITLFAAGVVFFVLSPFFWIFLLTSFMMCGAGIILFVTNRKSSS